MNSGDPQAFHYVRTKSELEYECFWQEMKAQNAKSAETNREEHNRRLLAKVYEEEAQLRAARRIKAIDVKAARSESFQLQTPQDTINAPTNAAPEDVEPDAIPIDADQNHTDLCGTAPSLQTISSIRLEINHQDGTLPQATVS